ncbi:NAD(P)-dependent oxidoreductase [Portibacter marinus]|uniref:NAD(P)-dependent oxidoreductase n=1 Tax=Portibacter marinus TaxID=2898660 RepID=UPI001F36322E|nr:NAD(P)-dependent oxidoreductase [Portibacter marinus]
MKIGVISEKKIPTDSRVCLTPSHCRYIKDQGIEIIVEPSDVRVFSDEEYRDAGIELGSDLSDCDVLVGVKEVPIESLIAEKTYFFFSHTFKEQVYNRGLLQEVLKRKIRLIDYEAITDDSGRRLIAFGKFAGIVGAHNGIYTYLQGAIPRMKDFYNYEEAKQFYKTLKLPKMKIALTGTGRVANGAASVLDDMGIKKVSALDYATHEFEHAVYTQLHSFYYAKRKDGQVFDNVEDFYNEPDAYESDFENFLPMTDLFINGIYWDKRAPAFFTKEDMKSDDFKINTIADITCDIAPESSIPSTIRPSTIEDPIYGYQVATGVETEPYGEGVVNVMAIDNLPNELPRDASEAFGDMFLKYVFPEMLKEESEMLRRASITTNDGYLNEPFEYLQNFVNHPTEQ